MKFKLRKFKKNDEESLRKNVNHIEIYRNTLAIPYPYTKKDAESWIKYNLKLQRKKNPESVNFVIDINKQAAGCIGFSKINKKHNNAELGYWLGKKYWNKGIMTKAIYRATRYGFNELKLKRIYAYTFVFNKKSQRVLEKADFEYEGKLRKYVIKKGKYYDCFLYAKIK